MGKTIRKKISIILAAVLLITSCPISVFAEDQVEPLVVEANEMLKTDEEKATESDATYELATDSNAEKEEANEELVEEQVSETTPSDATYFDCTSEAIDGIKVRVTAEEGAFPAESKLVVKKVSSSNEDKKDIDAAIDNAKLLEDEEEKNEPETYTFDIKVVDKDGNELQPADGAEVKVTFERVDNSKALLNAKVYHLEESDEKKIEELEELIKEANEADDEDDFDYSLLDGEVIDNVTEGHKKVNDTAALVISEKEKETNEELVYKESAFEAVELDTQIKEETSVVETITEGFSYYVVEFYYGNYKYILDGDSEIALSVILEALGLRDVIDESKITEIKVSDETLFAPIHKAVDVNDETKGYAWYIKAIKAFITEEKMTITADGKVYEIKVTDDQVANVKYLDKDGAEQTCSSATVVTSSMNSTWNAGWYVVNSDITMTGASVTCSGAVHLILANGVTFNVTGASNTAGITVTGTNSLTIYAQSTDKDIMGVLNATGGGSAAGIGGGKYQSGQNITINGGKINAQGGTSSPGIGGGDWSTTGGTNITINGGYVTAKGQTNGAGIGGGYRGDASNITITGGNVVAIGTGSGINSVAGIGAGSGCGSRATSTSNISITGGTVFAYGDSDTGIGKAYNGSCSNIKISTSLVTKADGNNPPTTVIANSGGDLTSTLSGKKYVLIDSPKTYKVTYDSNAATSGTAPSDETEYSEGAEVTVLDNTGSLAKTGSFFTGWNTKADGSGTSYVAGNKFNISADTTLYAKWTEAAAELVSGSTVTPYLSLQDAITDSQSGDTVRVKKNVTLTKELSVVSGKKLTFDLNGYTIDANNACRFMDNAGEVTIIDSGENGTITGGLSSGSANYKESGGAIMNAGVLYFMDGTITNCTGTQFAGGIGNIGAGILYFDGGTLTNCTAGTVEGGAIVNNGTFYMKSGTISNCSAGMNGGGVSNGLGTMIMTGGSIVDCTASSYASGIYSYPNITNKLVVVGGTLCAMDRRGTQYVTTLNANGGTLADDAGATINGTAHQVIRWKSGVDAATLATIATPTRAGYEFGGWVTTDSGATAYDFSTSKTSVGSDTAYALWTVAEIVETGAKYKTIQEAINAAGSGETVKLLADVTLTAALSVVSGKDFTFDLNGHTIDANNACRAFSSAGTLTITDSGSGGQIINGIAANDSGGAIYISAGTVTIAGGTISNCSAYNGGAVCVCQGAVLNLTGGTISGCSATNGGAIYIYNGGGTFSGGTISGCTATNGGGIYYYNSKYTYQAFGISDTATITNCSATTGSAIFLASGWESFSMTNGTINGQIYSASIRGFSVYGGTVDSVAGNPSIIVLNLDGGNVTNVATINGNKGVARYNAAFTIPTATKDGFLITGWKDQNNKTWNVGETIVYDNNASYTLTAQWGEPVAEISNGSTTKSYLTLSEAITAAQSGDTIKILKDISEASAGYTVATGVTLDVAGKTLTAGNITLDGTLADTGNGDGAVVLMNGELIASGNLYMPLYDSTLSASSKGVAYRLYRYGISMSKASNSSYLNIQTKIILYNSDGTTRSSKGYELLRDDTNGGKLIHMTKVTIPQDDKTQKTTEYRHTAAHTKEYASYYADNVSSTKVYSVKFTNHKARAGKIIKVSSNWEVGRGAFTYYKSYGNVYIKINADGSTSWSNSTAYNAQFN